MEGVAALSLPQVAAVVLAVSILFNEFKSQRVRNLGKTLETKYSQFFL